MLNQHVILLSKYALKLIFLIVDRVMKPYLTFQLVILFLINSLWINSKCTWSSRKSRWAHINIKLLHLQIALKIRKYRFANTLMSKQMDDDKLRICNSKRQNLLHVLASTAQNNDNFDLQKKVSWHVYNSLMHYPSTTQKQYRYIVDSIWHNLMRCGGIWWEDRRFKDWRGGSGHKTK